jgi:hypothetical protein
MSLGFDVECPECHGDRTLLETTFGLNGYVDPPQKKESGESSSPNCALPVRLIVCVRCHYLEMYHDVGLGKLG